jgi:MoxR-like ATPase
MEALTPSQTEKFIIEALKRKKIPYVAGPPGIGKSEIVMKVAQDFNLKLIDIILSQMQPEDLAGIPVTNEKTGRASYYVFDVFPLEGDPLPKDKDGDDMDGWLIFLDELSSASEEVMAAIYKLLLDRKVGNYNLHKKAIIVGAGNRESDSAIARRLPDTLITRMLPVTMKVSAKDWLNWANDPNNPKGNSVVNAYIKKFPDSLLRTGDIAARKELRKPLSPPWFHSAAQPGPLSAQWPSVCFMFGLPIGQQ